jgi:hypothetical protein
VAGGAADRTRADTGRRPPARRAKRARRKDRTVRFGAVELTPRSGLDEGMQSSRPAIVSPGGTLMVATRVRIPLGGATSRTCSEASETFGGFSGFGRTTCRPAAAEVAGRLSTAMGPARPRCPGDAAAQAQRERCQPIDRVDGGGRVRFRTSGCAGRRSRPGRCGASRGGHRGSRARARGRRVAGSPLRW